MTQYADASVIVSAVTNEAASVIARHWLASLAQGELMASKWCETKVASALALKVRVGTLSPEQRTPALNTVRTMFATAATMISIETMHFDRATELLGLSDRALRGGDALHLAIAAGVAATLVTLDRRMAEAGVALGLDVRLLA